MSRTIEGIQKAFRAAVQEGSKRLENTKTDAEFMHEWEKYAFVCAGFELQLESLGVKL